jgi:oxygen-independent coproporphyrinogen-3 oxidase
MGTNLVSAERELVQGRIAPPRAAYIHVPFCRHRCGYCNFTLVAGRDDLIGDYLRAIQLELTQLETPREVDTLYFGGGTPTHLGTSQFERLAKIALRWHPLADGYEWTVEANPADINPPMVELLAALGVTRLSLGGQSFRPEKLRLLERDHDATQIRSAAALALRFNMQLAVDLIFATPNETLDNWSRDLDTALALAPHHISTYGLTFERGTAFWSRRLRRDLTEVDEGLQRDMYALAIDRLVAAGYEHYEVSNFAQPGCRSRHNETYWSGAGYFAAGPGAARYIDGSRSPRTRAARLRPATHRRRIA